MRLEIRYNMSHLFKYDKTVFLCSWYYYLPQSKELFHFVLMLLFNLYFWQGDYSHTYQLWWQDMVSICCLPPWKLSISKAWFDHLIVFSNFVSMSFILWFVFLALFFPWMPQDTIINTSKLRILVTKTRRIWHLTILGLDS